MSNTKQIFLLDDIDEVSAKSVVIEIQTFLNENHQEPRIELFISTNGGNILDAFAIYDSIRMAQKKDVVVETIGLGKVFSAGQLILAAGTPGFRSMAASCRTMFHSCFLDQMENGTPKEIFEEAEEANLQDEHFIDLLVSLTKKKKSFFKNLLKKKRTYISAQEALNWGLIDVVI